MSKKLENIAEKFLHREWRHLSEREKKVIESFINRAQVSQNINVVIDEKRTLGERIADGAAAFGGSWRFIFIFAAVLIFWVILNSYFLVNRDAFDPYPYILLNLFLSMLAAVQAPIIMMSQNRQAARDRLDAAHDYEVNLKAELEIHNLQEEIAELREQKWVELIEIQKRQIFLLEQILNAKTRE